MPGHRPKVLLAAAALSVVLASGAPRVASSAAADPAAPQQTLGSVQRTGTVNLSQMTARSGVAAETPSSSETVNIEIERPATGGPIGPVPNPAPTAVVPSSSPSLFGADGISHREQRLASGGNQQSLEPPDQGLCVGNGHVIEAVNVALRVRSADTLAVEVPTVGLNAFFGLPPMIDRQADPVVFGPFLSDPRCYYDAQTRRFYVTVLEIDRHPDTGALGPGAATLLAVSQSDDPTQGWGLFSINALNDGTGGFPSHPNCPCFGDQPVIGADANGFFISTNEYSLEPFGTFFNGSQIYGLSKRLLAASAVSGVSLPFVLISAGNLGLTFPPVEGVPANIASVQPASTPPGAAYAANTEYFLSSFDVNVNKSDNRIAVWAMSNTSSLDSTPAVGLTAQIVNTEPYAGGPVAGTPVQQKAGPRPLGEADGEPLPTVNADDDRMQAPTYVNGTLVSALSTAMGANGQVTKTGVAWFTVVPHMFRGQVTATLARQGYIAAPGGTSLMYPFVTLDKRGIGAMALSLTGPNDFPSAGYIAFDAGGPVGSVHIARAGVAPEDGFTCYVSEGAGPPCRWGDYSYAVADETGHVWIAAEDIPGPRTRFANWGTFIGRLDPVQLRLGR